MNISKKRDGCNIDITINEKGAILKVQRLDEKDEDNIALTGNIGYGISMLISTMALNLEIRCKDTGIHYLETIEECINSDKRMISSDFKGVKKGGH